MTVWLTLYFYWAVLCLDVLVACLVCVVPWDQWCKIQSWSLRFEFRFSTSYTCGHRQVPFLSTPQGPSLWNGESKSCCWTGWLWGCLRWWLSRSNIFLLFMLLLHCSTPQLTPSLDKNHAIEMRHRAPNSLISASEAIFSLPPHSHLHSTSHLYAPWAFEGGDCTFNFFVCFTHSILCNRLYSLNNCLNHEKEKMTYLGNIDLVIITDLPLEACWDPMTSSRSVFYFSWQPVGLSDWLLTCF